MKSIGQVERVQAAARRLPPGKKRDRLILRAGRVAGQLYDQTTRRQR